MPLRWYNQITKSGFTELFRLSCYQSGTAVQLTNSIYNIEEQSILINALNDLGSYLIAVYGRRRVGKTYLVRETFQNFCLQHAGVYNGSRKTQLKAFHGALLDAGLPETKKEVNYFERTI